VCVVYVGFDDNDDLGMKGGDSAMPIWADFMKAALDRHPEWNGDWQMPVGIRKAEIDIRNGTLVRELDAVETVVAKATPTPQTTPLPELEDPAWQTEPIPEPKEVFVTNVPAEFRRVELFIGGTLPSRTLIEQDDTYFDESQYSDPSATAEPTPSPSATPVTGTWEQNADKHSPSRNRSPSEQQTSVVVGVCPITGRRSTTRCPGSEIRSFTRGTEPKEFCTFHR
jgi:membrane peptidoglycan carboxypeptidase